MCSCLIFNSESCCPAGGLTNFERIISANVCACVYVSAWACVFTVWCYKNRLVCSTSRSRQGEPINKINYKLSLYHIHTQKYTTHTVMLYHPLNGSLVAVWKTVYSCKSPQRISVQRHMAAAQCSAPALKDLIQVLLSVCYGVCVHVSEKNSRSNRSFICILKIMREALACAIQCQLRCQWGTKCS